MLSAVLVLDGQAPRLFDMPYLLQHRTRDDIRKQNWACKFCGQQMDPRFGLRRNGYFAHARRSSDCPALTEAEPESEEHRQLKRASAVALRRYVGADFDQLEFEVRVPEAARIADALLTLKDGTRIAIEAQVSPLSVEDLDRRTEAYLRAEYEVVWVFTENRLATGNWAALRDHLLDQGHVVLTAHITIQQDRIALGEVKPDRA